MNFLIDEKIKISLNDKQKVLSARKKYLSWIDKWISIEKSYEKFLNFYKKLD